MPPTHRIPRLFQLLHKPGMLSALNSIHALEVDRLDAGMDGVIVLNVGRGAYVLGAAGWGLVVCVAEAGAPVAEIGADDEEVGGVCEVGGEEAAVRLFRGGGGGADHDGNEGNGFGVGLEGCVVAARVVSGRYGGVGTGVLQREHLVNVGKMHLQAVLVFICLLRHGLHSPFLLDTRDELLVHGEVTDRCPVLIASSRRSTSEVVMMRRTKQEDAFPIPKSATSHISLVPERNPRIRPVRTLIGPCSSRPGVRVTSMPARHEPCKPSS